MIVNLTDIEQVLARTMFKLRDEFDTKNGFKDKKVSSESSEYISVNGYGAELAVCRLFNVYPNLKMTLEGNSDLKLFKSTVDVKCTKYEYGHLLVIPHKIEKPCDIYILVVGEIPTFDVKGFCTAKDVFLEEYKQTGKMNGYAVPQIKLTPIGDLIGHFRVLEEATAR